MITNSYFVNRTVLITGGTSGLGNALAESLTKQGAKVAVVARHIDGLKESQLSQGKIKLIRGDISDKSQIHRIYAEALTLLGSIDILINNASALGPTPLRLLLDTDCEDLSLVLETNLLGAFRLTKLVLPGMILGSFGVVVNISSDAAINPYPSWGAYSVSKAALDHLTLIFKAELTDTPIQFLALDPGDMDTPLHLAAVPDADRSTLFDPKDSAKLILEQIADGKFTPTRRSIR